MSRTQSHTNYLLITEVILPSVGIFALDLFLPLGAAVSVLYAVPVLITLWFPGRRLTILAAFGGSLLTALGFFLSPPGGILWMVLFNRSGSRSSSHRTRGSSADSCRVDLHSAFA